MGGNTMAELNLAYYTNEDHYSDGDIEEKMLQMAKRGDTIETSPDNVEFPIVYHFSEMRKNILCWYPFEKKDTVLEIGAGCGAITGLLCEKAGHVTSVELSKRRAEINYERNKDKDNLTIMVGNLHAMMIDQKYDYVVINGVLEYAMSFTEGNTPYETFLQTMQTYLKDNGKIIIAIENKLGLKYFAGAPEDHTDLYFLGINGYEGNHSVRTFSKIELTELLKKSGFSSYKFYYPYPDYKFPKEIYSDEILHEMFEGKEYSVYTDNVVRLFHESKGAESLLKENIMDRFMNSFLVIASKNEMKEKQKILYAKMNQERKTEFRLMTLIMEENGKRIVRKKVLNSIALPFLQKLYESKKVALKEGYQYLPCVYENEEITYPFLKGNTITHKISEWVENERLDQVECELRKLYTNCISYGAKRCEYQTEEFQKIFGTYPGKPEYECVNPANIDMICDNLIEDTNGYQIIDYEWICFCAVPTLFILWRTIHELFYRIPRLSTICAEEEMLMKFDIDYSDIEIFTHWNQHFVYAYVGSDGIDKYSKERRKISLENIVRKEKESEEIHSKLYYDLGKGLTESQVIESVTRLQGENFSVEYDLSQIDGITGIRWNPNKGHSCIMDIRNVDSEEKVEMIPGGDYIQDGKRKTIFLNEDPIYFFKIWSIEKVKHLKIEGTYHTLTSYDLGTYIMKEKEKNKEKTQELPKIEEVSPEVIENNENKTLCKKVKEKIKSILRVHNSQEENTKTEPVSSGIGCVDCFSFENGFFQVTGWAFDLLHPMKNERISFYQEGKCIYVSDYQVIARKDVAQSLQNKEADMCGYLLCANIHTGKDVSVYFEYDQVEEHVKLHLGDLKKNCDDDQVWIIETIEEENSIGNITNFEKIHVLQDFNLNFQEIFGEIIDVIIPIYNGIEYFDHLFSSIEKTKMSYRLILVDDHSPDPRVKEYLENYANTHSEVTLIRNEDNLGFVQSVNKALKLAEHHVALVNTDVEVPEEWLERLMFPIITGKKVATSTPFTTCGTICSFPEFCKDNAIFENMRLWKIDNEFQKIKPRYTTIPTGVGFCMGMNFRAIQEIGVLDAESFGKGYGEENDWCQRAIEAGYKNVQVENLYVYHKHGGSFPSEQKIKLLEENQKKLLEKHPSYNEQVASYCSMDPVRKIRLYLKMKLWNQKQDMKIIVAFDHNLGGGATEYLNEKTKIALKNGICFITVRYDIYTDQFQVIYQYKNDTVKFTSANIETVFEQIGHLDEIWINELVTYQEIYKVLDKIIALKYKYHAQLRMLLHDFFCICPAINLMNEKGEYCQVGTEEECNHCIHENKSNACLDYNSGSEWRKHWNAFLNECDEIFAFSDDSAHLLKKAYPCLYKIHVIPHKPHYVTALNKISKTTKSLNIGLLGVLCYKKGLQVVKDLVSYIEKNQLNICVKLIGISDEKIESPVFSQTGRYTKGELPRLTLEQDIDIFLIPSIWPETFSYTTSEIISMNMPIAVFPIGAPVERVKKYEKGLVLSEQKPDCIINEIESFFEKTLKFKKEITHKQKFLFIGEEISFASRYRVEHFREQLLYQGYDSVFIQMNEKEDVELQDYDAIIFYRCSDLESTAAIVKKAKQMEIPVYYDIDDYIFDYDQIDYLDFLKGKEYKDFRETTKQIHACMEQADAYITSTETLASVIKKEFPNKKVIINRNCASMEMQIISHDASEQIEKKHDKIYIGYFSGSKTHDNDFSILEDVLFELMEKYPQIQLKMVGVFSQSRWKKMESRIERMPFMDWRKLPEVYAGIDINLMPLEDTLFHCCKSENKWMEAALVRVPSIVSWNEEVNRVLEDGKDAFLCKTEAEWKIALEKMITDANLRRSIGRNAYKKVMERYVTQKTGKEAREELLCSKSDLK